MILPDFLTQDDLGYIHLTGHRIGLEDVIYFHQQGDSPEMLHARFPSVELSLFYRVIAFYLDNEKAIDTYCGQQAAKVAQQRAAAPSGPSVDELRRRREAQRVPKGA